MPSVNSEGLTGDLARLQALYSACDQLIDTGPAALFSRTEVSGWSAAEHLAHACLANELCARNLAQLGLGAGLLVRVGGEPLAGATQLLAEGHLPRGQAQAPRMVRPPASLDLEMLRGFFRESRLALESLDRAALEAARPELHIAHQILGPLSLAQWARFAAVHTRHHVVIAAEVLGLRGLELRLPPA